MQRMRAWSSGTTLIKYRITIEEELKKICSTRLPALMKLIVDPNYYGQARRQTDRQTGTQTDRQTSRQTKRIRLYHNFRFKS